MNATLEHARAVRAVDAHFARSASRSETALLRTHLPVCAPCRRRYERHLLLDKLVPGAPSPEERLATELGLARAPARKATRVGLSTLVVAVAAALLWWPSSSSRTSRVAGPVARGGQAPAALFVYRIGAQGTPALVDGRIQRDDELAFAYTNPGGLRYLLVFGADEHGHVYWFHPAWPVGAPMPPAVEARSGIGPHELSEAVRHRFDGRRLDVSAVFSDERLTVDAIERAGGPPRLPADSSAPRMHVVTRSLEIAQ